MRKKILAFVFAAALLVAMAVPLFSGVGTAQAIVNPVSAVNCTGANGASGNAAGGSASAGNSGFDNAAPGPPFPAQGAAHAVNGHAVCVPNS